VGPVGIPKKAEWPVLLFAMVFPTCIALVYFQGLAVEGGKPNPLQQVVYATGKTIQFLFPLVIPFLFARKIEAVGPWKTRGLITGILFGILVSGLMLVSYHYLLSGGWLIEPLARAVKNKMAEFNIASPYRFLGLAFFLTFIHSLLEEFYWRWFVFGLLKKRISLWPAIVMSSIGFMAHHVVVLNAYFPDRFISAVVPFSLAVAFGGGVWAWMMEKYQTLLTPWISHLIVDAGLMWIGWVILSQ